MTSGLPGCHLAGDLTPAFRALLESPGPPRVAEVAQAAGHDAAGVPQAMAWLEACGRLERDGDSLVGAHGLTHRATPHSLSIGERTLHTWCAYDAVAIPVALGASAHVDTTCPTCRGALTVDIERGRLPDRSTQFLWLPGGRCEHVIDDFCSYASMFCTDDHLQTWRGATGNPPGNPVTFSEVPAIARAAWADISDLW